MSDLDRETILPLELYINGDILTDDGKGNDRIKGDKIYTAYSNIIDKESNNTVGSRIYYYIGEKGLNNDKHLRPKGISDIYSYIKCDVDVVGVGEKCNGQNCPEKSAFWGKTWFCVCITNCTGCLGDCPDTVK